MKRLQKQYSTSMGSTRMEIDNENKRVVLRRMMGKPIRAALEFGSRRIGKRVALTELSAHVGEQVKGHTHANVYYIAKNWLQEELGVCRISLHGDQLMVTFNASTREAFKTFTSKYESKK